MNILGPDVHARARRSVRSRVLAGAIALLSTAACARAERVPRAESSSTTSALLSVARQMVVVTTADWNATSGILRRFDRNAAGVWQPAGPAIPVVVGRTGIAWGDASLSSHPDQPVKHEGDGRSPAGVFPLDTVFGFAPQAEVAWLRMPYAALLLGSDCVDDEKSAYYNTVVDRAAVPHIDWNSAERMREIPQYRMGVIIGYNASPPVRGRGSCIFLHSWSGPASVTAGCTAFDVTDLEVLLRWIDRARRPVLVQLTDREYTRLAVPWRLPAP